MEDSSRFRIAAQPPTGSERPAAGDAAGAPPAKRKSPAFVGDAMKALFETAEVSIKRGDETRVITKNEQDVEQAAPPRKAAADSLPDELPPGLRPHVDLVLWLVLAAGLFGIAGWMLMHG
jgi:hypothetical protein